MDGGKGGSEPLWAHEIVREAASRFASVTAVTGYVESPNLPANVRTVTTGLRRDENFLAASVAAKFTLQCGAAAIREFIARRPDIVHHILPFGLEQTFNPLQPFLGNTPLVLGPVQGESYKKHFEQISLGGVETKQGASTAQPLSNRLAAAAAPVLATLNRTLVRRADAVVAISDEAASFLSHFIDERKLFVIPPGVNTARFALRGSHTGSRIEVVTVGYLLKRKRVDVILRAINELLRRGTDVRLTIAGTGPEQDFLTSLADELQLPAQSIRWLGFIPNSEVARVYQEGDIYVSASEHEGLPTAYLEAMSCGLPLVCCDNPGARAAITSPLRGTIVRQEDAVAMAGAILEYGSDRGRLERRANDLRNDVATTYDWSTIGERYANVYDSAFKKRRSP